MGVEAKALAGLIRAMNTITVELPRQDLGQIGMPDVISVFRQGNTVHFLLGIDRVE
jgi:hypothetical protein